MVDIELSGLYREPEAATGRQVAECPVLSYPQDMDEDAFWKLLDHVDRESLADDEDAAVEPLISQLSRLAPAEVASFEEHLTQRLYALDGRRYAEQAGKSGDSDDGFLYARCFVVAQGKAHYRRVLANPALMPKSIDEWCEALLGVARAACEQLTGVPGEFDTPVSYETGSNRAQWE
jgi:hypothetical protein